MRKSAIGALMCLIAVVAVLPLQAQQMTDDAVHSPYMLAVDEYVPAPGQFTNDLPIYEDGDDAASMAAKCTTAIAGDYNGDDHSMITLGGYGGYVTFHFDHSIANIPDQRDFYILGNAMQTTMFPELYGGSSEPGIIMVAKDVNHNNLPDDPWYEISGSADVDSVGKVIYNYEITYKEASMKDIPWTDNQGEEGVIARNSYHTQEYFPQWIDGPLAFKGTRLPRNGWNIVDGGRSQLVLMAFRYGYADNRPNSEEEVCSIDIGWAVDENRQPVNLDFIDFVRVYNGMNQTCGQLGETSTEVAGAHDLHLEASLEAIRQTTAIVSPTQSLKEDVIYNLQGQRVTNRYQGISIKNGKKYIKR